MMDLIYSAHKQAAQRENASSQAVVQAWHMNGRNLKEALVAGLMNLGGVHAPIKETYTWLEKVYQYDITDEAGSRMFSRMCNSIFYTYTNSKMPGFGSSVVKGRHDPLLTELFYALEKYSHISSFMRTLFIAQGKNLWPNLSYYTALACLDQDYTIEFCEEVMIRARISGWCELLKQ